MKLGILKADAVRPEWVPDFGEYPDMFIALLGRVDPALDFVVYDVEQGEYPTDIDEVDAYLITGSKSGVYEDKPWISELQRFVQLLHARQKRLLGICFGHQLIAQALGGQVQKSDKGWGMGVHSHRFARQPQWHDGGAAAVRLLVSHQDQVLQPPAGAEVLAGSEFCTVAVMQLGEHILTFQGHPEFVPDYSRAIMTFRREIIGEQVYSEALASVQEQAHEGERVARWMINFLRTPV